MGLTAQVFARMLKVLLPPGKIWRLDPDGVLSQVLLATGDELERAEGRIQDLLVEADPRTADELLPDFERELALPSDGTLDERRARVVALLVRRQRYRPVDFQTALAPLLGQAPEDVEVLERKRSIVLLMADDREIYRFFIYRDPSLPGTYDLDAAQELISSPYKPRRGMKPSHTEGQVIESVDFLCDDEFSLCDRDLLGG